MLYIRYPQPTAYAYIHTYIHMYVHVRTVIVVEYLVCSSPLHGLSMYSLYGVFVVWFSRVLQLYYLCIPGVLVVLVWVFNDKLWVVSFTVMHTCIHTVFEYTAQSMHMVDHSLLLESSLQNPQPWYLVSKIAHFHLFSNRLWSLCYHLCEIWQSTKIKKSISVLYVCDESGQRYLITYYSQHAY